MRKVITGITLMVLSMGWGLCQSSGTDPLQRYLFSAELIMRNQRALQLDEQQRNYIIKQVQETQSEFTPLKMRLQGELETLTGLLEDPKTEERALLNQLDQVLDLEKAIKRTHLRLALRLKDNLTERQRERLSEIRDAGRAQRLNPDRLPPRRQTRPGVRDSRPQTRPRVQDSRPRTGDRIQGPGSTSDRQPRR